VPENASHIDDLLAAAAARDAQVAALAADKKFAGDPDPYRRPLVDVDDLDEDDEDDEDDDADEDDEDDEDDDVGANHG
jgi:ribosome-binding factor A